MPKRLNFERYIAAFNAGDTAAYSAFYAPGIVLTNGAGETLEGVRAIVERYAALREAASRTIRVLGKVETEHGLAAVLASTFLFLKDGVRVGETEFDAGDRLEIESAALYSIVDQLFTRIDAVTLRREIERKP